MSLFAPRATDSGLSALLRPIHLPSPPDGGGAIWGVGGIASDGNNPFVTTGNTTSLTAIAPTNATFAAISVTVNGLTGYSGLFFPSWTDRRGGGSEEIWTASIMPDCVTDYILTAMI